MDYNPKNRRFIRIEALNAIYVAHIEHDVYVEQILDELIKDCKKEFYGFASTEKINALLQLAENIFLSKGNFESFENQENFGKVFLIAQKWLAKIPPMSTFIDKAKKLPKIQYDINSSIHSIVKILNSWIHLLITNSSEVANSIEIQTFREILQKNILEIINDNHKLTLFNNKNLWEIDPILVEEGLFFFLFKSTLLAKFTALQNFSKKLEFLAEALLWQIPPISDKIQSFFFLSPTISNIIIKVAGNLLNCSKQNAQSHPESDFFRIDTIDSDFFDRLLTFYISQEEANNQFIEQRLINWTLDRICFIDTIIIKLGICEITQIEKIPKAVSINEYVEIAKLYSSKNSAKFINSILDQVKT